MVNHSLFACPELFFPTEFRPNLNPTWFQPPNGSLYASSTVALSTTRTQLLLRLNSDCCLIPVYYICQLSLSLSLPNHWTGINVNGSSRYYQLSYFGFASSTWKLVNHASFSSCGGTPMHAVWTAYLQWLRPEHADGACGVKWLFKKEP
jgi:hypothetical protein